MSFEPELFEKSIIKYRHENKSDPIINSHAGPGRFFAVSVESAYQKAVDLALESTKR